MIPAEAGIGLRFPHHRQVLAEAARIAWVEVHTENYLGGGAPLKALEAIREKLPVSLHGVGLSLGSAEGLDPDHLARVCGLAGRIEPGLVSEHLSWSVTGGRYLGDLLPLPLTEESLNVVCANIHHFQDRLARPILVENPSTYLQFGHSTIPEWEFMAALAARTGCGLLCDVNNIHVSAMNHGWNPAAYLAALPPAAIGEIHLAGHRLDRFADGTWMRVDDHGSPVDAAVWSLYDTAAARFGAVPVLIEWDNNLPPLETLLAEAEKARRHARAA